MDYDELEMKNLIEEIRKHVKKSVKKERYEHSVRTAEFSARMGRIYQVDDTRCYLAGISHDICKNLSDSEMLKLASRDGRAISALEAENPQLLHGRAAAVFMQEQFGVSDAEVLQAIASHTFGGAHLCPLAKILYAADKIEPGRPHVTSEYLEKLLKMDLDSLVAAIIKENVAYLRSKGKTAASATLEFLAELTGESGDLNGNQA